MNVINESTPDGFDDLDPETRAAVAADLKKFNVHANNLDSDAKADRKDEAVGLIRQAELLESDAQAMRERAYRMDPGLKKKAAPTATVQNVDLPPLESVKSKTVKKTTNTKAVTEITAKPTKQTKKTKAA